MSSGTEGVFWGAAVEEGDAAVGRGEAVVVATVVLATAIRQARKKVPESSQLLRLRCLTALRTKPLELFRGCLRCRIRCPSLGDRRSVAVVGGGDAVRSGQSLKTLMGVYELVSSRAWPFPSCPRSFHPQQVTSLVVCKAQV